MAEKKKVTKKSAVIKGTKHVAYKDKKGDVHIDHPGKKSGKYKDIDLTKETGGKVKTTSQGIAAAKDWHNKAKKKK